MCAMSHVLLMMQVMANHMHQESARERARVAVQDAGGDGSDPQRTRGARWDGHRHLVAEHDPHASSAHQSRRGWAAGTGATHEHVDKSPRNATAGQGEICQRLSPAAAVANGQRAPAFWQPWWHADGKCVTIEDVATVAVVGLYVSNGWGASRGRRGHGGVNHPAC